MLKSLSGVEYIHPLVLSREEARAFRTILIGEGIDLDDGPAVSAWIKNEIGIGVNP